METWYALTCAACYLEMHTKDCPEDATWEPVTSFEGTWAEAIDAGWSTTKDRRHSMDGSTVWLCPRHTGLEKARLLEPRIILAEPKPIEVTLDRMRPGLEEDAKRASKD